MLYLISLPNREKNISERAGLVHYFCFRKWKLESREENVPFWEALESRGELQVHGNIWTV